MKRSEHTTRENKERQRIGREKQTADTTHPHTHTHTHTHTHAYMHIDCQIDRLMER